MIITPDLIGAFLDAVADRITARIDARSDRATYDSRHLPPRISRRRFAEICRTGRVLDARRDGRDWTCSQAAWDAARERRSVVPTAKTNALDVRAEELLTRAGLRCIGSRR